ncbi:methyltransferase domain-containing protein [Xylariaceae sp. FL0016]|nr:methyltransferase domain-containing protein [Xylariaceae sp. FL0016]
MCTTPTTPPPPLLRRAQAAFWGLLDPWMFMSIAASFIPSTIANLIRTGKYWTLLSPSRFREAWFGLFWGYVGPNIRADGDSHVVPLLEGRVSDGRVMEEAQGPGIGGIVLELGAGSGFWVDCFGDEYLGEREQAATTSSAAVTDPDAVPRSRATGQKRRNARTPVTRVYGIEPSADQHPALRAAIARAGLDSIYRVVPVGVQDLSDPSRNPHAIARGSVDCIVSVLCLCSIPDPEVNVRELYSYLKPGGRWYVYEHVRCENSWYMRAYQRFVNLFWPYFLGGCLLCRPTGKTLCEAGPWSKVDVTQPPTEQWHHCVPHIIGVYTK